MACVWYFKGHFGRANLISQGIGIFKTQVKKLPLKKVKKIQILKTFLQLCLKYASEQILVKIWCLKHKKVFKTLIISRF